MTASTGVRPGIRVRRLLAAAAAVSALVGGALPATASAATDGAATRWTPGRFPDGSVSLSGVTKPDAYTTWVTGFHLTQEGKALTFTPAVYTKDDRSGGPWTELPTAPGVTGRSNAIAATSRTDALLVGDQIGSALGNGIMTQHWNGSSWTVAEAPTAPNSISGGLLSLSALSPTDVWAAGWLQIQDAAIPDPDGGPTEIVSHDEGVIEHWDGQKWTRMPLPQPYPAWALNSISASAPNDVWAVGNGFGDDDKPLVLHYDGVAWTALPTPPFGGLYGEFNGVAANGPNDVWATGRTILDEEDRGHALVMHWNGTTWTRIATPPDAGPMTGVAAADGGVVTVGMTLDRQNGYALRVSGNRATSLNLPTALPDGTTYSPWSVGVDRRTDKATIVGAAVNPTKPFPDPLALTGRV